MRQDAAAGFMLPSAKIVADILVPRYYDPRIAADLSALKANCALVSLGELTTRNEVRHDQGKYVPKIFYGTGPYPYIRTSDIANWELKASPKHGVSQDIYEAYAGKQEIKPQDVLLVHEGTYLIGAAAMVTPYDGPMLFQHHLARLRVLEGAPFNAYFLLALLESPIVQRQIRAKQFSADIIDSVVGRLPEVVLPIPLDTELRKGIERQIETAVLGRAKAKEKLAHYCAMIDQWLRGAIPGTLADLLAWEPRMDGERGKPALLGARNSFVAFSVASLEVIDSIVLPKYFDPTSVELAKKYRARCDMRTIGELLDEGILSERTGDEIGKVWYGTGPIPFVRTSDFGSWELKRNPKQGISESVYLEYNKSQEVRAGDILLVRDGTYLVGTSVLLFEDDLPLLYCGGLLKYRCNDNAYLAPGLFFSLLNLPFVRKQMRNKQFTRDVIDTLGKRVREIILPIPRDETLRNQIAVAMTAKLTERNAMRAELRNTVLSMP